MTASALAQFCTKHIAKGIGRLIYHRSHWKRLRQLRNHAERRKILGFTTGIDVANPGHCHPAITKATQSQLVKPVHGQIDILFQKPYIDLAQPLILLVLYPSLNTFFSWSLVAEAVEATVKLTGQATRK
ncbi:MAG: hypothetical protein Q9192_006166 [Flavoplaca navasiana]